MSDVNPNVSGTEETQESTVDEAKNKLNAEFNAIASSHAKRESNKVLKELESLKEIIASLKPVEPEAKTKSDKATDPEVLALKKEVADMKKATEAAKAEVRQEKLRSKVDSLLKSKVMEDFADVATEKLMSQIKYDNDGIPFMEIDGEELSVEEGSEHWLKANKRFLAAPDNSRSGQSSNRTAAQYTPQQVQQIQAMDPLSDDYLLHAGQALIANGGLKPIGYKR